MFDTVTSARRGRRAMARAGWIVVSLGVQAAVVALLVLGSPSRREKAAEGPLVPVHVRKPATTQNPPPAVRVPRDNIRVQTRGTVESRKQPLVPAGSRAPEPDPARRDLPTPPSAPPEPTEIPERAGEAGGTAGQGGGPGDAVAGAPGGGAGGPGAVSQYGPPSTAGAVEYDPAMTPPVLVTGPRIAYTDQALERGVEGTMIVECVVSTDGSVHGCRVLRGLPFMDRAVVDTLQQRRYRPATRDGAPVEVRYTFTIRLKLPR